MSWLDWLPLISEGVGLVLDRDSASTPDPVEQIDLEELARLMTMNTRSPWGGMTYSQDDDGRYTAEYSLGQTQPIFDNAVQRALNPDQAYQMPAPLRALHEALMQQRLGNAGGAPRATSPRPARRPYAAPGGGPYLRPFSAEDDGDTSMAADAGGAMVAGDAVERAGGLGGGRLPYQLPFHHQPYERSFNEILDAHIPPPLEGSDPSAVEQFVVENAGNLGMAAGAALGIPGLGLVGNALANNYWGANQWQSPVAPQPTLYDVLWQSCPFNMSTLGALQSPFSRRRR
jgi:hypothetical protein